MLNFLVGEECRTFCTAQAKPKLGRALLPLSALLAPSRTGFKSLPADISAPIGLTEFTQETTLSASTPSSFLLTMLIFLRCFSSR